MTGPIRSISQAFAIIRLLSGSEPLVLSDICRRLALSPSSGLNLLRTLVAEGALERDGRTKQYRLSPAWAASNAMVDDFADRLAVRAKSRMQRFAQDWEAAVGLWKMVPRDRMQLVAHAESDAGMRLRLADAQRQPLGGGAVGRALAALQDIDAAELGRRHALVRWQGPLPLDEYARQISTARKKGFAIDEELAHRGVVTAAVALADAVTGICFSASILSGSRSRAEVDAGGRALVELRDAVAAEQ